MNERQLEVQKLSLAEEKKLLKQLKACYEKAAKDCAERIAALGARTDMEHIETIIYQTQYQQAIKKQLDSILDVLHTESYTDITTYLQNCYNNGFIGAMYDLQGQGIPLIFPIHQDEVVYALQNNPKLVKPYYDRLGEDVEFLKKAVRAQVSRGVANGSSWAQVAAELAQKMRSPLHTALYNSMRIARTEGHRVQQQSQWDALNKAKDKGCDIVKQWDSTLDGRTRPSHRMLDGQIKELDEDFEIGIKKAKYPGAFGRPEEDIHCRCCMTQRARWALDKTELETLKARADYFHLDKSESFEDFKNKYLKLPENADTMNVAMPNLDKLSDPVLQSLVKRLDKSGVTYREITMHTERMTEDEIIKQLSGGDNTSGSCASVGLAYIGQKGGVNVLDFRGGDSQTFFSTTSHLKELCNLPNAVSFKYNRFSSSVANGARLLKQCELGKEYYFVNGRHASIVRKIMDNVTDIFTGEVTGQEEVLQYLELQSATRSGWTDFNSNIRHTLKWRFGETTGDDWTERTFMIDVDSLKDSDELKKLLGYINTQESEQRKGTNGTIK